MRYKIRTTQNIQPGMVIRTTGEDSFGLDLTAFRQVAKVNKTSTYSSAVITFTDGTRAHVGYFRDFQVARGKAQRNAAKARASIIPSTALAGALNLLGDYARLAVTA